MDEGPALIFNEFSVERAQQPFCFQPLGDISQQAVPPFEPDTRHASSDLFPSLLSPAKIGRCRTNSPTFLCRGDGNLKQPFRREQEKWLRLREILFCKSIDVFLRVMFRLGKTILAPKNDLGMSREGHGNVFSAPQKRRPFAAPFLLASRPSPLILEAHLFPIYAHHRRSAGSARNHWRPPQHRV